MKGHILAGAAFPIVVAISFAPLAFGEMADAGAGSHRTEERTSPRVYRGER